MLELKPIILSDSEKEKQAEWLVIAIDVWNKNLRSSN